MSDRIRFTKEKIKGCPFCGGKAFMYHETICCGHGDFRDVIYIECDTCGSRSKGMEDRYFSSNHFVSDSVEEKVLQQWNQRSVVYVDTDSVYSREYTRLNPEEVAKTKAAINFFYGRKIFPEYGFVDPIRAETDKRMELFEELKKEKESELVSELIKSKRLVLLPFESWSQELHVNDNVFCCTAETRDYILQHVPYEVKIIVVNCLQDANLYIVNDPELKEQFLSMLAKKGEAK